MCGTHRAPLCLAAGLVYDPSPGLNSSLCWVAQLFILGVVHRLCYWFTYVGLLGWMRPFFFISFCFLLCYCLVLCCLKVFFVLWRRLIEQNACYLSWHHRPLSFQFSPDWHPLHKLCCGSPTEPDKVSLLYCVLKGWLWSKESILFGFPPARGTDYWVCIRRWPALRLVPKTQGI